MSKKQIIEHYRDDSLFPNINEIVFNSQQVNSIAEEWGNQLSLDFARFLEEHTEIIREEKITLYRYHSTIDGWGNYTLEDIFIEFKQKYEPE